jgi:hypothetical protein
MIAAVVESPLSILLEIAANTEFELGSHNPVSPAEMTFYRALVRAIQESSFDTDSHGQTKGFLMGEFINTILSVLTKNQVVEPDKIVSLRARVRNITATAYSQALSEE